MVQTFPQYMSFAFNAIVRLDGCGGKLAGKDSCTYCSIQKQTVRLNLGFYSLFLELIQFLNIDVIKCFACSILIGFLGGEYLSIPCLDWVPIAAGL